MTSPAPKGGAATRPTGAAPRFCAVIFDMNGVVTDTASAHAASENRAFPARTAGDGVRVLPAAVDLLGRLRAMGVATALVTASRNAEQILDAAGVADLFDVRVDGDAAELGPAGSPDPAAFLVAARRLEVDPEVCAVIEDAVAGVRAAHRGGFGLVVGVDRGGQRQRLLDAGADMVVDDLGQLDLGAIRTDPWLLAYEGVDPAHEGHREALMTLGNGYVGTRGAAPESRDDGVHYPGTYLAGVYNRLTRRSGGGRWRTSTSSTPPTGCRWTCASAMATGGRRGAEGVA